MNRREFCTHACQVASLTTLATVLDGCSGGPSSPSGSTAPRLSTVSASAANGVLTVSVDAASPLAAVGGAALVQTSGLGSFLVMRTATDTFSALTAVCTHEACTVDRFANQTFQCECHGSQFSSVGAVVQGPASRSLQRFTTQFSGSTLTITL